MFKILKADKDTYVTDRIVNSVRSYGANIGIAGSIDLFKLYGATMTGTLHNVELSRALIHFDLSPLISLVSAKKVDYHNGSFFARVQLTDVYGGQATPDRYTLTVSPLSMSFNEGHGKDVVYYGDYDVTNFLTASNSSTWMLSGCNLAGTVGTPCDYYSGSVASTQFFTTGEENLDVDVTQAIIAVLSGTIPDSGFRIAFTSSEETDFSTYFVKRFASRQAYDESKHPRLVVGFDDSIRDSSEGMTLDSSETLFLFNYDHGTPTNLAVTGQNCIALKMQLAVSGGFREFAFTGSQHYAGANAVTGVYSASIVIPSSDAAVAGALAASGSVLKFTPVWGNLSGTVAYLTGTQVTVIPPTRGSTSLAPKKFVVTAGNVPDQVDVSDIFTVRVNVFDYTSPLVTVTRLPVNSPGALQGTVTDAFYSIRETTTQSVLVPFDTTNGSTRLSSDNSGLFFQLDCSNLEPGYSYVIDVLLSVAGAFQTYRAVSAAFSVTDID